MGMILLGTMLLLFAMSVPVAFAVGLTSLVYMLVSGQVPLPFLAQRMVAGVDSFPLLAIPFFLLAGELMSAGGITKRLVRFASALVGHITGGLANVAIVANMVMAGMSGSAVADASAAGAILTPPMLKSGYPPGFTAAVNASAATVGPVIPPSINFVIYGSIAEVSTGRLFAGGIVPGVLMGLYMMGVSYVMARRGRFPKAARATGRELWLATRGAVAPMLMPLTIMGGIIGGVFTPTESAAVAAFYALLLGFLYRELRPRDIPQVFAKVMVNSSVVLFITSVFAVGGWIVAFERLPQTLTGLFGPIARNPVLVLLLVNVLFLIMGCFMDALPLLIVVVPMFLPLIRAAGIDLIHFGVVITLNLMIGLLTPPVGMLMYICCRLANVGIEQFVRYAWPFIAALIVVLLMISYIPETVLLMPRLLMGSR
ncbi:MAG TPA: TRAP transporter large permease [Candidatus Methylomirabilis sp.]|nr:TRAP transporter large permease [Candidatus Methylomirabilis sp.]